jgi:hypothetical protein
MMNDECSNHPMSKARGWKQGCYINAKLTGLSPVDYGAFSNSEFSVKKPKIVPTIRYLISIESRTCS